MSRLEADMEDDDITRQAEEVEALSAIYGEEWCVIDESDCVFSIRITDGQEKPVYTICLQVMLQVGYPSTAPPQYLLNAPWLRGANKQLLANTLDDIYCDHIGESVIFLWVEGIREFIQDYLANGGVLETPPQGFNVTEEVDFTYNEEADGDAFDPAVYEAEHFTYRKTLNTSVASDQSVNCPPIYDSEPLSDRRSKFIAHLAPISHAEQVDIVMSSLKENKKIANATHNILAYRIRVGSILYQGCDDDGETHAGARMLHLMQIVEAMNVMVVVTRWYGGVHLGPDRFKHINNLTRILLEQHNFVTEKNNRKGAKSKGKR